MLKISLGARFGRRLAAAALATLALGVSLTTPASAWFQEGHKQIADIAWTRLTPKTRQRVQEILLAGDRKYRPASTSEADVRKAFLNAAAFADDIKQDTGTMYETTIAVYNAKWQPNLDPFTKDNETSRCKTWHYYDTPLRVTPDATPHVRESNALVALTFADYELTRLQGVAGKEAEQAWWLYWVTHIVGDLHQPLHSSESFEFSSRGDAGGNGFKLDVKKGDRTINLHGYWDGGIDHAALVDARIADPDVQKDRSAVPFETTTASWVANTDLAPSDKEVRNLNIKQWIADEARLADAVVYTGVVQNSKPDAAYTVRRDDISRRQAVLAGYRLAEMLNRALGK